MKRHPWLLLVVALPLLAPTGVAQTELDVYVAEGMTVWHSYPAFEIPIGEQFRIGITAEATGDSADVIDMQTLQTSGCTVASMAEVAAGDYRTRTYLMNMTDDICSWYLRVDSIDTGIGGTTTTVLLAGGATRAVTIEENDNAFWFALYLFVALAIMSLLRDWILPGMAATLGAVALFLDMPLGNAGAVFLFLLALWATYIAVRKPFLKERWTR